MDWAERTYLERVEGIADLRFYPSTSSGRPDVVLSFIPGNPGLVEYYPRFLEGIRDTLAAQGTNACVFALGHLGHLSPATRGVARSSPAAAKLAGLHEQALHHAAWVSELNERFEKEGGVGRGAGSIPLVLVSHSVGSWISLEVVQRHPNLVSACVLLFPTLSHIAATPNGRKLAPLFGKLSLPAVLGTTVLSYVPRGILTRVVGLLTGQSAGSGAETTTGLVADPQTTKAALFMAQQEMDIIKEPNLPALEEYGERLDIYYTADGGDHWVSEEAIEEIKHALQDKKGTTLARCEEGMLHAFCLRDEHADSLAVKVAGWVRSRLENEGGSAAAHPQSTTRLHASPRHASIDERR